MVYDCRNGFPFGIICLSLLYANVVLLVEFLSPVECLEEPCSSEGVDTSVMGWATSFFNAVLILFFAMHLQCFVQRPVYISSVLLQCCFGLAFVAKGLGLSFFSNSGFDDNVGQQLFYIMWASGLFLMTLGVVFGFQFIYELIEQYKSSFEPSTGLKVFLQGSFYLLLISWMAASGGYIWCAVDDSIHTAGAIDNVNATVDEVFAVTAGDNLHQCIHVAATGEAVGYLSFAIFSIPAALIVRGIIRTGEHHPRYVLGLANSWVPFLLVAVSWTVGAMLIVWMDVVSYILLEVDTERTQSVYETAFTAELNQVRFGTAIVNFGMVMTAFLWHNISFTMTSDIVPATLPLAKTSTGAVHKPVVDSESENDTANDHSRVFSGASTTSDNAPSLGSSSQSEF